MGSVETEGVKWFEFSRFQYFLFLSKCHVDYLLSVTAS